MKRETLNILLEAAQQAPESPQLNRAVRLARKQLSKSPPLMRSQDYDMALANTSRALDCIADGLRWLAELRGQGKPKETLLPVLMEQNRKACRLLEL